MIFFAHFLRYNVNTFNGLPLNNMLIIDLLKEICCSFFFFFDLNCLLGKNFMNITYISGKADAGEYCVFSKLHRENHPYCGGTCFFFFF